MLNALLDDLNGSIDTVALCAPAERERLLEHYNRPTGVLPDSTNVVARFAVQAALAPGRIALRLGDDSVSYGQLERRLAALAGVLHRRGIGSGDWVGVHMSRSLELVVAILGVLRSGAGYVPLEAGLPPRRLALMVARMKAGVAPPLVLTQPMLSSALVGLDCATISVEPGCPPTTTNPDSAPALPLPAGSQAAYLIFTSGSSGEPKGVVVGHAALARYADWAWRTFADGRPAASSSQCGK